MFSCRHCFNFVSNFVYIIKYIYNFRHKVACLLFGVVKDGKTETELQNCTLQDVLGQTLKSLCSFLVSILYSDGISVGGFCTSYCSG